MSTFALRGFALTVAAAALLAGCTLRQAQGDDTYSVFTPRLSNSAARPLSAVLYSFGGNPDGEYPMAGLLAGTKGEYYGTTFSGGSNGAGTVYEITAAGKEKILYSFTGGSFFGSDGANPTSALIMDKKGALYGTTERGGGGKDCDYNNGCGIVFKLTSGKQGWGENILFVFKGNDGLAPHAGLLMTKNGSLVGTTYTGLGSREKGNGTVFELTPSESNYSETILHAFGSTGADGLYPADAVVADSSGNLYGTTSSGGGACSCGTVFELKSSGSTYTYSVIYRFKGGTDGSAPIAGLLRGRNGVLYGLTSEGGTRGNGTVFELVPEGSHSREKVLYAFKGGSDGSNPDDNPGLVADRSGDLYGTTVTGGGAKGCQRGCGTVFEMVPSGKGFTEQVLYAFQSGTGDGANPYGSVTIDGRGDLLGSTQNGGSYNEGSIFSLCCAPPPE